MKRKKDKKKNKHKSKLFHKHHMLAKKMPEKDFDISKLKSAAGKVKYNEIIKMHAKKNQEGEAAEKYDLVVDGAGVEVEIVKDSTGTHYNLQVPEISLATSTTR